MWNFPLILTLAGTALALADASDASKGYFLGEEHSPMEKIWNGYKLHRNWPFLVSLQWRNQSIDNWTHFCGATLVSIDRLVTAASCFPPEFKQIQQLRAAFGSLNYNRPQQQILFEYQDVILHNYVARDGDYVQNNDIAVILLPVRVVVTDEVDPISVRTNHTSNTMFLTAGWGYIDCERTPDFARGVVGQTVKRDNCEDQIQEAVGEDFRFKLTDGQFCMLFKQSDDDYMATAQGDQGGPVIAAIDNKLVLVGAVSFSVYTPQSDGGHCVKRDVPQVFTSVPAYNKFLRARVSNANYV